MMADKRDEVVTVRFDEAEAMMRFIEGFAGIARAPGLDPRDALDALGQEMPATDLRAIRAGVRRILAYLGEELAASGDKVTFDRIPGAHVPRRRQ
jgi:hypothetical protein